ncbi:unnamed protein product [Schistosoma curassoni]|uniref:IL4R n=1 Tax=Schistosoma curassoni TaxID=6186 RepID=A0A183JPM6_9TREM|nr:unnamed protein product [Schistosoma curassoni]
MLLQLLLLVMTLVGHRLHVTKLRFSDPKLDAS